MNNEITKTNDFDHAQLHPCPYVCIICDTIVKYDDVQYVRSSTLKKASSITCHNWNEDLPENITNYYKYNGTGKQMWMEDCLLSPNACYVASKDKFVCCQNCAKAVRAKYPKVPRQAIVNLPKGRASKVLTDLTEIEIAFISPVRGFGHFFYLKVGKTKSYKDFIPL